MASNDCVRIGHTQAELEAELGTPLPAEGPILVNHQENILMVFALNPTLFFTLDDIQALDLFKLISRNNLRSKIRFLCNSGHVERLSPGVFRFNPKWLQYRRTTGAT
jgi:hypothetical protein